MVHAGRIDEVNAYCLCDVAQTAAIFLRVELLRGNIDRPRYRELARGMLAFIDAQPKLGEIAGKINRESFTLGEVTAPPAPPPTPRDESAPARPADPSSAPPDDETAPETPTV
jgi:hypothetical protein